MESKFYSEFENSKIVKAIKAEKSFLFYTAKFEKKIFFFLFLLSFFVCLSQSFQNKILTSLFFISFSLFGFALLRDLFFENFVKNPKPKRDSLVEFLSFEVAKVILKSIDLASKNKISEPNSSLLLASVLDLKDKKLNFFFRRTLISKEILKNLVLKDLEERREIEEILKEALKVAKGKGREKIEILDLIFVLAQRNKIFRKFLIENDLKPEDIMEVSNWIEYLEKEVSESKKFWEWKNLIKKGALARGWTAGYTVLLDQFSFDLTKRMRHQKFRKIFAHEREVKEVERILSSPEKNNVLIVGEAGSGRRSILESLANKCALGESLPELNFNRVVYLDIQKIIAVTKNIEEAEYILDRVFQEVIKAGNVILVIDNIHQYIGVETERKAGVIEISGILFSYLPSPLFKLIGITTFEGLHKNIEQRPLLLHYFEKVEVSEITEKETLLILEDRALRLESKYKILFSFLAIKRIILSCEKYLPAIPFPEKGIEVMDEAAILVSQRKEKIVLPKHIDEIVTRKSKIPVGEIEEVERKKLLKFEELLHRRIVDQEEAVREVSEALRRARAELKLRKGPIGCFLFLGPTGVGKTETAKAIAEIYFGSEEKMIRLDMSEFQNLEDISRLLGRPGEEGLLTTPVRERPFSLILLDEFEKAHPNILNLFLQVFDEGHLTDGMGRRVNFQNTIIVATSNAGYQIILEALKEKLEWSKVKEKILDFVFEKGIFRPELINRFDAVVVFKPLSKENLLQIAELQLKKIKKQLAEKNIDFLITDELKEKIVELSYDITFGARNMQRVIQDKVGNVLAKAILNGQLKRGQRVEITPENFTLKTHP